MVEEVERREGLYSLVGEPGSKAGGELRNAAGTAATGTSAGTDTTGIVDSSSVCVVADVEGTELAKEREEV